MLALVPFRSGRSGKPPATRLGDRLARPLQRGLVALAALHVADVVEEVDAAEVVRDLLQVPARDAVDAIGARAC